MTRLFAWLNRTFATTDVDDEFDVRSLCWTHRGVRVIALEDFELFGKDDA